LRYAPIPQGIYLNTTSRDIYLKGYTSIPQGIYLNTTSILPQGGIEVYPISKDALRI
jgi:hypothetical protein